MCVCVLLAGGIRILFSSGSFRIIENLILPFDEHIFFFLQPHVKYTLTIWLVSLHCINNFITPKVQICPEADFPLVLKKDGAKKKICGLTHSDLNFALI